MMQRERMPARYLLLLLPFMAISSYLMFDIPYFLHDTFGYGFCDTGGPCTRLFDNVPYMMLPLGLFAMFNWWAVVGFLSWAFVTGRWDPSKPRGQQWIGKAKVIGEEPK